MSRDDYIQHAHRHDPAGTDPIDLDAVASGLVQLGGKMPWFESTYIIAGSPHLTSGDVHTADQFGGTDATVRTTDNPAGFTDVLATPQVYTDGTFFSCDYSTAPEIAVNVLQAGVYHMTAEFTVNHYDVSAGSPFFAGVGMQVTTSSPTLIQYASDSRYISDTLLTDGLDDGTPPEYQGEMANARVTASKTFYLPGPATVQLFYLHTATLIGTGIRFSIFRVSDGGGNSAPGSGSGSGIIYDFANTGDWLQVATTSFNPDTGVGIDLTSDFGITLAASGNVTIDADQLEVHLNGGVAVIDGGTGGQVFLEADQGVYVTGAGGAGSAGFSQFSMDGFEVDSTGGIFMSSFGSQPITIGVNGADMELTAVTGKIKFLVGAGPTVAMEIRHDGSIHIPSGTSIIADL